MNREERKEGTRTRSWYKVNGEENKIKTYQCGLHICLHLVSSDPTKHYRYVLFT